MTDVARVRALKRLQTIVQRQRLPFDVRDQNGHVEVVRLAGNSPQVIGVFDSPEKALNFLLTNSR